MAFLNPSKQTADSYLTIVNACLEIVAYTPHRLPNSIPRGTCSQLTAVPTLHILTLLSRRTFYIPQLVGFKHTFILLTKRFLFLYNDAVVKRMAHKPANFVEVLIYFPHLLQVKARYFLQLGHNRFLPIIFSVRAHRTFHWGD
jgi:hypothetical protein